jgi:hypothetical protein
MSATLFPFDRPRSSAEVLDAGFRLFRASLLHCLPYALGAVIAGQAAAVYDFATGQIATPWKQKDLAWLALTIGGGLVNVFLWGVILLRQRNLARAVADSGRAQLAVMVRLWWPATLVFVICILPALAVILLVAAELWLWVAAVVPVAIWLLIALWPAFPARLDACPSVVNAVATSLRLTHGHWWRTAAILFAGLIAIFVFYALGGLLGVILAQLAAGADFALTSALSYVLTAILGSLFTPFLTALSLALYEDLRVRRQGVDLAMRLCGLDVA